MWNAKPNSKAPQVLAAMAEPAAERLARKNDP
jgi:hypothetical protein